MSRLPRAQHAWEASLRHDEEGRPLAPRHHRLLMLDVPRTPTADDAARLEDALSTLEARFPHGPEGLLFALGWGPGWFERHTALRAPIPRPVPLSRWEDPLLEDIDACLHLASDDEERLARVTDDLFGPGPLDQRAHLRLCESRTGFVGAGLPAQRLSLAGVRDDAPLLLGFRSGLRGNQATEAEITIVDGPLAGGTTMHVSRLELDLDAWYAMPPDTRAARMYAPTVTTREADALTDDAASYAEQLPALAARYGIAGHAQAAARARVDNRPRVNRRDFATLDEGRPGTHFVSLQRTIEDFNATRAVMNAADARYHHSGIGHRANNGLNDVIEVRSRATFVIPPRPLRSYPFYAGIGGRARQRVHLRPPTRLQTRPPRPAEPPHQRR
jgi:hypothetical protein